MEQKRIGELSPGVIGFIQTWDSLSLTDLKAVLDFSNNTLASIKYGSLDKEDYKYWNDIAVKARRYFEEKVKSLR